MQQMPPAKLLRLVYRLRFVIALYAIVEAAVRTAKFLMRHPPPRIRHRHDHA